MPIPLGKFDQEYSWPNTELLLKLQTGAGGQSCDNI